MIKPGFSTMRPIIDEHIKNNGFQIYCEIKLTLSEDFIRAFWLNCPDRFIPDMVKYFSMEPSTIIIISGKEVVQKTLELRNETRKRLCLIRPCDGFHASENLSEALHDLEVISKFI